MDRFRFKSLTTIRERDETGHITGLDTFTRSLISHPLDTARAVGAFSDSYSEMKHANLKGGNLAAHESANYNATKLSGDPNLSAAISAVREQSKNHRTPESTTSAARKGYGDTRTEDEINSTMEANKQGRERAMIELKGNK